MWRAAGLIVALVLAPHTGLGQGWGDPEACRAQYQAFLAQYQQTVQDADLAAFNAARAASAGDSDRCWRQMNRAEAYAEQTEDLRNELWTIANGNRCAGYVPNAPGTDWGFSQMGFAFDPNTGVYTLSDVHCLG